MEPEDTIHDVIVIGSGLAGLTAAHALKRHRIGVLLLEKDRDVGASWARRHPQLILNTHRALSSLPGLKYPAGTGAFPKRDSVVSHLQAFQRQHGFAIEFGVEARFVRQTEGLFAIETSAGLRRARYLIVATGRDAVPRKPRWHGLETFTGRIVQAADFGDAQDYAGKSVLVIGGGNSGFDLLNHLSRVDTTQVWFSLRRFPGVLPRRFGRLAVHRLSPLMALLPPSIVDRLIGWTQRRAFGDLSKYGFPSGPSDAATRLSKENVAIGVDDGAIAAVKRGRISVVPEVMAFGGSVVTLRDGRQLAPDVVLLALGYTSSFGDLLGDLDVLDKHGVPTGHGKQINNPVPGLWFVGMKPSLTSYFWEAKRESRSIARSIAAKLSKIRRD
ncbi:NAD(P)/FAD-dependent oxidoreductase [Shinella sp.]|uniref:flavin-containing monooxygenase n=1 Tax=Shinella sp. TaxID=1870904 RepID=UPI0028AEB8E7|nr:NAD(P)/FAD-dependent oxidoreductase [Shinella sp.]